MIRPPPPHLNYVYSLILYSCIDPLYYVVMPLIAVYIKMCVLCCPALFISSISCLNSFRVLINFLHFIVPFIIVHPTQNISYKCHECRDLDCLVHNCILVLSTMALA